MAVATRPANDSQPLLAPTAVHHRLSNHPHLRNGGPPTSLPKIQNYTVWFISGGAFAGDKRDQARKVAELAKPVGGPHVHRFYLALILLSVPASTAVLAHSGTDQEEKACTPDVHRFCRKLMDQNDLIILGA